MISYALKHIVVDFNIIWHALDLELEQLQI